MENNEQPIVLMEDNEKPILLYVSVKAYKDFQKKCDLDWKKQLKAKTVKLYKPAEELYNKILAADIVIYGSVLQKSNYKGEGIIPEDLFKTYDDPCFWPRLLEEKEIEQIKSKCELVSFKNPQNKQPRKKRRLYKRRKK